MSDTVSVLDLGCYVPDRPVLVTATDPAAPSWEPVTQIAARSGRTPTCTEPSHGSPKSADGSEASGRSVRARGPTAVNGQQQEDNDACLRLDGVRPPHGRVMKGPGIIEPNFGT